MMDTKRSPAIKVLPLIEHLRDLGLRLQLFISIFNLT